MADRRATIVEGIVCLQAFADYIARRGTLSLRDRIEQVREVADPKLRILLADILRALAMTDTPVPAASERMTAERLAEAIQVGCDEDGKFDELVFKNGLLCSVHVEMMDDNVMWMAMYPQGKPNGSRIVLTVGARGKLSVVLDVEP